MSTIVAISTPMGAGGIGIVRVSGKDALRVADAIFISGASPLCLGDADGISERASLNFGDAHDKDERVKPFSEIAIPLQMTFGRFIAEDFTDKGYAVYFPAAKAYTGEDTVEFYLHGGVRILRGAVDEIIKHGAVLADKGEFTKRAFLSGRMSLADAEGVIDMINAESAAGLRAAYRQMEGYLSKSINNIMEKLLGSLSGLEAALDYPDEMEDVVLPPLEAELNAILADIDALIATKNKGRLAKHGITAVLSGKTNAGKSSLMNALLGEERAIVTPIAGTTRDTIEDSFEIGGVRINLVDTAGLRESDDEVESIGIARAKKAAEYADVVLNVIDLTDTNRADVQTNKQNIIEEKSTNITNTVEINVAKTNNEVEKQVFTVYNKCDVIKNFAEPKNNSGNEFYVSAKTGEGIDKLAQAIASLYTDGGVEGSEVLTSERHISALYRAKSSIESAILSLDGTIDCTLIDLKEAYDQLGEITGQTATEDILDEIFERFCIGK